jgi:histidinol-phosphate aminotransferase
MARMGPEFVRQNIREMAGYTPGEQPDAGQRVVKLNTNENPYPPSPRVMQAVAGASAEILRRYPNPTAYGFRDAAAKLHGVAPDQIIAGNGSDDILTIATRCFVPPGGTLAYPDPTYSLYPVLARLQDAKGLGVPWEGEWGLPVDALLATKANAIYLANPNSPSGTFVAPEKVGELASRFSGLLLIDEAYADFADANCIALVREFPNVVVSRTLSKAYSLAGLRFGYAIARAEVIAEMVKVKDSYNCDALSILAATAAIQDQQYARGTWEKIKSERTRVTAELTQLGWMVLASRANFIFASMKGLGSAKVIYEGLKEQGILVRYWDLAGIRDKIRVTIGRADENDAFLAGIEKLRLAGKAA